MTYRTAPRRPRRVWTAVVAAGLFANGLAGCSSMPGGKKASVFSAAAEDTQTAEAIKLASMQSNAAPPTAAATDPSTHLADLVDQADRFDLLLPAERAKAMPIYEQALTLAPADTHVNHRLAVICDLNERFGLAEKYYGQALASDPRNSRILSDLGYSYLLQRRFEEAETRLRAARAADPTNEQAICNLALLYAHQGDKDRCLALSRLMSDGGPAEPVARSFYAEAGVDFDAEPAMLATASPAVPPADAMPATPEGPVEIVSSPPADISETDRTGTDFPTTADVGLETSVANSTPPQEGTLTLGESPFASVRGPQQPPLIDELMPGAIADARAELSGVPLAAIGSQTPAAGARELLAAMPASHGAGLPPVRSRGESAGDEPTDPADRREAAVIGMHTGLGGLFGRYAASSDPPRSSGESVVNAAPPAAAPADPFSSVPQTASPSGGIVEPPPYRGGATLPSVAMPPSNPPRQAVQPWTGTVPTDVTATPPFGAAPTYGGPSSPTVNGFEPGPAAAFGSLPVISPKR